MLRSINEYKSPIDKLECLRRTQDMLSIGYTKFRNEKISKSPIPAADESEPRFFCVFIKSIPKMMHSNLNYINAFSLRKNGLNEFFFMLLKKTILFVQYDLSAKTLDISEENLKANAEAISSENSVILISGFVKQKENI